MPISPEKVEALRLKLQAAREHSLESNPPRKRGRPKKVKSASDSCTDSQLCVKRKRGRPKKVKSASDSCTDSQLCVQRKSGKPKKVKLSEDFVELSADPRNPPSTTIQNLPRKEKSCIENTETRHSLRKRKNRERQEKFMKKIIDDPQLYSDYLKREKERNKQRKVSIHSMPTKKQNKLRRKWRKNKRKQRERQKVAEDAEKLMQDTPPASPVSKREKRKVKKLESKLKNALKVAAKYKMRYLRASKDSSNLKDASPTPRKKVKSTLEGKKCTPSVRRSLLECEVIKSQIKHRYKTCENKEKNVLSKLLCGKIIKKYRHGRSLKNYGCSYKRLRNAGNGRKKRSDSLAPAIVQQIHSFYEEDGNSRVCPGKLDTVQVGKTKLQKRLLCETLRTLHLKFLLSYSVTISYPQFCRLRPKRGHTNG